MSLKVWPLLALALAGCARSPAGKAPVRVAAASDLALALEAMRGPFEAQSGETLDVLLGSSGKLARQLVEGAPFDLFASASRDFTDEPIATGACDGATRAPYAEGRLVIATTTQPVETLGQLQEARFARVAIANPDHAPYGRAAKEALGRAGLWTALAPRIVYADSVQQALQLARSGNVEAALVARSLVPDGVWVDPALHAPLTQTLVVCTHGPNTAGARAFARYLLGEAGQQALRAAGFAVPVKESP